MIIIIAIIIITIYDKEKCSTTIKTRWEKERSDQTFWKTFKKGGCDDSIIAMI